MGLASEQQRQLIGRTIGKWTTSSSRLETLCNTHVWFKFTALGRTTQSTVPARHEQIILIIKSTRWTHGRHGFRLHCCSPGSRSCHYSPPNSIRRIRIGEFTFIFPHPWIVYCKYVLMQRRRSFSSFPTLPNIPMPTWWEILFTQIESYDFRNCLGKTFPLK